MTNRAKRWLWILALLACALLVLKSLVCGIYRVDTPSMEPTIQGTRPGGERVLVVYDHSPPARFDLVVVLRKGEDTPVVKRAAGLPNERVQIVDGDLLVNGQRLGPDEPRPRPIPVFDERWQDSAHAFPIAPAANAAWKREAGEWTLVTHEPSRLEYYGDVTDGYLDAEHALVVGEIPVNDLVLELELAQDEPGSRASLTLSEAGDRFELALELAADGRLTASLLRHGEDAATAPETLATAVLERGAPGWHRLRFSNVDNALSFERDGVRVLRRDLRREPLLAQRPAQAGPQHPPARQLRRSPRHAAFSQAAARARPLLHATRRVRDAGGQGPAPGELPLAGRQLGPEPRRARVARDARRGARRPARAHRLAALPLARARRRRPAPAAGPLGCSLTRKVRNQPQPAGLEGAEGHA